MNDRLDRHGGPDRNAPGPGGDIHQRDDLVERLLRMADNGPEIPAGGADRVKEAIRPHWQRQVRAGRRRRTAWAAAGLVAAASLMVALLWAPSARRGPVGPVAIIASMQGAVDLVSSTGGSDAAVPARIGTEVLPGTWIRTGDDGRASLRLNRGQSLRIDRATRVRVGSPVLLELARGGVYVDSGAAAAGGIEVHTALGVARDIGTQFEVRQDSRALAVRVREGVVVLTRAGEDLNIAHGTAVRVFADGTVETTRIPVHGEEWDWVQRVAPPLEIEGLSVVAFLDWVSRETGLRIRYSSPQVERFAADTVLHGSIEGVAPAEAPDVVLPSCGLAARRLGGSLTVGSLGEVEDGD
jgi:ferric-dicitrate binding protein FerR (iron transport regulator)